MAVMLESSPFSPTTLDNNPPYKYYIFSVKFICGWGGVCVAPNDKVMKIGKEKKKKIEKKKEML